MGQFEMTYPLEASCAVSEVSLPLQDYFRNVEEESSAALRKEVFRFFIFFTGGMSMVGRPAWEEAVNRKLSFQNPFSCFLALCSGDAHGISQCRLYFGLFSGQTIKIAEALPLRQKYAPRFLLKT